MGDEDLSETLLSPERGWRGSQRDNSAVQFGKVNGVPNGARRRANSGGSVSRNSYSAERAWRNVRDDNNGTSGQRKTGAGLQPRSCPRSRLLFLTSLQPQSNLRVPLAPFSAKPSHFPHFCVARNGCRRFISPPHVLAFFPPNKTSIPRYSAFWKAFHRLPGLCRRLFSPRWPSIAPRDLCFALLFLRGYTRNLRIAKLLYLVNAPRNLLLRSSLVQRLPFHARFFAVLLYFFAVLLIIRCRIAFFLVSVVEGETCCWLQ